MFVILMNQKKLERIRGNRVIGGVCSGLGQHFNLDPIVFRFTFIALLLAGGSSIFIYLILWIIIPNEPNLFVSNNENSKTQPVQETTTDFVQSPSQTPDSTNLLFGLILVAGGVMLLLHNLVPYFRMEKLWPAILMIVGIGLIFQKKSPKNESL
jgi:phage shock protein C